MLGGAPFNVAWHLQGFGLYPYLVTRVGDDDKGRAILQSMRDWGMDIAGVQIDPHKPTGSVSVTLEKGQPRFAILPDQAYDFIQAEPVLQALTAKPCGLVYHGSLGRRSPVARASLDRIQATGLPAFTDINLRPPWWEAADVAACIRRACYLKINHEELQELAPFLGVHGNLAVQAKQLQEDYDLELLLVTCGAEGAFLQDKTKRVYEVKPSGKITVKDTVGAGDAFSAVILAGLLQHAPLAYTMRHAQDFAEKVCTLRGAVCSERNFYRGFALR